MFPEALRFPWKELCMTRKTKSFCTLAGFALALAAYATSAPVPVADWNRPYEPATASPPVFLHNMAIANQPYPHDLYLDYMAEPTRFEFRPRNLIVLDENGDAGADQSAVDYGADYGADTGGGE